MARRKVTNELKVGLFTVICVLALLGFMFKTGALDFKKEGYEVKVVFNIVAGVQTNAPVRLAGVEIGQVSGIELAYKDGTKVLVTIWLNKDAKLRKDSTAYITALGLMGEKYIEVTAGLPDSAFLEEGDVIFGEDPMQFDALAKKGETIAEALEETLEQIKILAKSSNGVVTDNKEKIDAIFENMESTTENFKEFSEDVKRNPWKLMSKGK